MTLNGGVAVISRYFSEIDSFRGALRKSAWLKIFPNFLWQKCSPKRLVFSDISLTMIWCREPIHRGGGLNAREVAILDISKAIFWKRCKIGSKFALITNRKSCMSFRLVLQETQLSLRDRATRACQLKSGKVLHKCRRLVFEKLWN